jgi:hypothetical protein
MELSCCLALRRQAKESVFEDSETITTIVPQRGTQQIPITVKNPNGQMPTIDFDQNYFHLS